MKVSAGVPPVPNAPRHDQHINSHYTEYVPQASCVKRLSAPVKRAENNTYRFNGKAERHDVNQIGKHGIAHGLVKPFRMAYCNIIDCIHILNPFIYVL